MLSLPSAGALQGGVHRFPLRIYVEDTDYSGYVYHANYLTYAERGRTEMLRAIGIEQRVLLETGAAFWAVREARLRFHAPARLDDMLIVETRAAAVRGASTWLDQRVVRDGETLADMAIHAAFLTPAGRPQRQPAHWRIRFEELQRAAAAAW